MFVRSLLIENFRSIKKVDISFQSRVTVLIGENGCGKSSILNALEAVLGRNVPKDGFDISASDFHRNRETFYYQSKFSESEDLQTKNMRIVIGFGGSFSSNHSEPLIAPLTQGTADDADRIMRADEASELFRRQQQNSECETADNKTASAAWEQKACASYSSLQKFKKDVFMTDLLLRGGRIARVLNFYLCVEAIREGSQVFTKYYFEDASHNRIELDNPLEYLKTIKTVCPFLRIRPGALLPPIRSGQEQRPAQDKVDSLFSQAYSELTENAEFSAQEFIASHRDELERSLNNLEKILVHNADDETERIDSAVDEASEISEDEDIRGNFDRYTRILSSQKRDGQIIKERLQAPLSTLNPLLEGDSGESDDYERFSALLRGTGARSLAMLAFADSFFKAQAQGFDEANQGSGDYYPLLSVEDPEAYLHPLMLTSVWSLIDRMSPQRLLSTNNSDLLSAVPLTSIRRMVRSSEGIASIYKVNSGHVHINDLRRIAYHLRIRRGAALFMRFWLLVEGETECWLLPEIARVLGFDLWSEGIELVEFAQCGLGPLANLANELGIGWHLLADGDKAGHTYGKIARPYAEASKLGKITVLKEVDIENCFWESEYNYKDVFRKIAGPAPQGGKKGEKSKDLIKRAIRVASKPGLALALGKAMQDKGPEMVPDQLRKMIYDAVGTARKQGRRL
ncbi:MAG: ATP-dependent nuclease [Candidatus Bruticola sp.]